ncbi:bifunctional demethylmenaquinone methyltransferase/2-methoxy-6-polyprenyl-1,4-benzoquinol methylase UbiE [Oharaeibacter diazotrophicus]|uniref:Ubiquinone/menaquinone biosynthesis C-methyltransferase UbiE n=1 Tax=Oharaeibacter diazotrophicus TaxID=1920512 RepID=A0A4R6R8C5_9HYPH|nr:bifunctional demethylmenaquinone methyltransferase/2-methoxy-6-polyprenyl-1,4-benzoquinol methylase UbiE [Oharaeibacter diazotrophicus]TDP82025.1 demethylmenaquinone methyltransferase [Oharaeibacter diazotrophicus]BBE73657.1 ubiquinone/menaquinone biosynthesis C-methyltransferase UbiE [Pleomorphomonas sp. SM30]GLS75446.1 ubiquinone/menaquinone biosynthesis C-methyltransferase UbiE [Oharaeibacter diazotrophicus]
MSDAPSASFGFRDVTLDAKQDMVDEVFHRVASRYDVMNDVMSAGLHRVWKDAMVSRLAPPRSGRRPFEVVDVAGGTGDIAFRIVERSDGKARVTVADINASMLGVGRERAEKRGIRTVDFVEANAEALPFEDGRFDAYTIAFGIRNVPRIDVALSEAYRVLKPGGRFLCLEFSAVDVPLVDKVYDLYSFNVIPVMGRLVAKDEDSYRYLVESIRRFPNQERFKAMIEDAGFSRVTYTNLTMGVAALHVGVKI